jgi:glycine cleavage system H lipoate-binding protein
MVVASALMVVGVGFMVLGVSFLPVIGILVGIPILGLAWHFMTPKAILNERIAGFLVPGNVMFHPGHAWARAERYDIITVGMDDFAVKLLGSVDSISLPAEGSQVQQGSTGWLMTSDNRDVSMLCPVEGRIVAINRAVVDSPSLAFSDPYGKGWLFKVANENPGADLENMVPTAMVPTWFEDIRENISGRRQEQAAMLYQDGGEPVSGLARAIDPRKWDEVAKEFLLTT